MSAERQKAVSFEWARVCREAAFDCGKQVHFTDWIHGLRHAHPLDMSARPRPVAPAGDEFGRNPIA